MAVDETAKGCFPFCKDEDYNHIMPLFEKKSNSGVHFPSFITFL